MRKNLKKQSEFFLISGKSHSAEKCKRGPLKAYLTSISSASRSSVAVSVNASQPIKSVTSLVLKKVTAIVCVFYEKR